MRRTSRRGMLSRGDFSPTGAKKKDQTFLDRFLILNHVGGILPLRNLPYGCAVGSDRRALVRMQSVLLTNRREKTQIHVANTWAELTARGVSGIGSTGKNVKPFISSVAATFEKAITYLFASRRIRNAEDQESG